MCAQHVTEDESATAQTYRDEALSEAEADQRDAARLLGDNFASCLAGLLFSLEVGLCLPRLSAVLAATGHSDEPRKALRRYLSTARHVIAWHLGDPLAGDPATCPAARSAATVRQAHAAAAAATGSGGGGTGTFSAEDMRTVQTAFVAYALLPSPFGIRCGRGGAEEQQQLAAYARHWHRVSLALGMAETDSALAGDLRSCRSACAHVKLQLVAALQSPPPQFRPLADALAGGVRLASGSLLAAAFSPPAVVAVFLDTTGCPDVMRRRAMAASVGLRPVRDAVLAALLRCLLRLLTWAPRRLHRRLFVHTCCSMGIQLPEWWRLEHAGKF